MSAVGSRPPGRVIRSRFIGHPYTFASPLRFELDPIEQYKATERR